MPIGPRDTPASAEVDVQRRNNAGGWPTGGYSESSGIPHVWNSWIIYPMIALALGVAIDAWHTHRDKPITEDEIRREVDRLGGGH